MLSTKYVFIGLCFAFFIGFSSFQFQQSSINQLYEELQSNSSKPKFQVFEYAMNGYIKLDKQSMLGSKSIITIIDFSISANKKRLWVIDLEKKKIIYHTLVSHGKKSGDEFAKRFSNVPSSHMSSLGFYITGSTYHGKHGLSLYLDGIEKGFNDKARERAIVMHGANYVNVDFIRKNSRLGRSFGCPALSHVKAKEVLPFIADQTCLFIYFPEKNYLENSTLINAL